MWPYGDEDGGVLQELVQWRFANKLLVTGTPLQNSIKELWCLLHFLDPQQFPDCAEFEKRYSLSSSLLNAEEVGFIKRELGTLPKRRKCSWGTRELVDSAWWPLCRSHIRLKP